nr:MAG TPA_asm: hypothetical protein [Caudoviricetes sp.]
MCYILNYKYGLIKTKSTNNLLNHELLVLFS